MNFNLKKKGIILPTIIVFSSIFLILIVGLTSWFGITLKSSKYLFQKEQSFQIAESGIDYALWFLNHYPTDFQDGTGEEGPYVHDFLDKDGNKIGEFSLEITPPETGTTQVTVKSTGYLMDSPDQKRTIEAVFGKPSLSNYAILTNSDIYIRQGTEVFGRLHSNKGIRFDGIAHNLVSSSKETYDDPSHSGDPEYGVHTHIDPIDELPYADIETRLDVFQAGREFPVPTVDFDGLTIELSEMKTESQSDGHYYSKSDKEGYHIVLKTNDTYDLYKVTKLVSTDSAEGCKKPDGDPAWDWTSWSIDTENYIGNYAFPDNGLIFVEDHVWVDGQINSAHITITAARFPDSDPQEKNININNDLLYTNYDGQDSIGLIAQNDINVGLQSDDDLRIDAALLAKGGRVGRAYFPGPSGGKDGCSPYDTRSSLTILGLVISNGEYGFAYTDGTGYETRTIIYDSNLENITPPYFPDVGSTYELIQWAEVDPQ